jgi:hypothetical protein
LVGVELVGVEFGVEADVRGFITHVRYPTEHN